MAFNLTLKTKLLLQIIFLLKRLYMLSPDLGESNTYALKITSSESTVEEEKIHMSLREVL